MRLQTSLGMMSGTSIDGSVSAAIIRTDGENLVERVAISEYAYEESTGERPIHHLTKAAEIAYRESKGDPTGAASVYPTALRTYVAQTFKLTQKKEIEEKISALSNAFFGVRFREVTLDAIIDRSTTVHLKAAKQALQESGLTPKEVQYVGYHGQTLFHDTMVNHVTVQVGDAQALADALKIPVVEVPSPVWVLTG